MFINNYRPKLLGCCIKVTRWLYDFFGVQAEAEKIIWGISSGNLICTNCVCATVHKIITKPNFMIFEFIPCTLKLVKTRPVGRTFRICNSDRPRRKRGKFSEKMFFFFQKSKQQKNSHSGCKVCCPRVQLDRAHTNSIFMEFNSVSITLILYLFL